jgi:SAM-dependent methyltransferase
VTGLDPVQAMVDLAREGASGAEFFAGGADGLAQAGECDAIIALNVLAYMTDDEIETFWSGVAETLAPGGAFLVFPLQRAVRQVRAERRYRGVLRPELHPRCRVDELLAQLSGDHPGHKVRANPLAHAAELSERGLTEVAQAFFNDHPLPPKLLGGGDTGRVVDIDEIGQVPRGGRCSNARRCSPCHGGTGRPDQPTVAVRR